MTKNQINYLLVLATLVVCWLYLFPFFMDMKMQNRMAQFSKSQMPMMNAPAYRAYPGNPMAGTQFRSQTTKTPGLSPEVQRMIENLRTTPKNEASTAPADQPTQK